MHFRVISAMVTEQAYVRMVSFLDDVFSFFLGSKMEEKECDRNEV